MKGAVEMYLLLDAIVDVWRMLRHQRVPQEHIDRYAIVAIVIAWILVATVTFVAGVLLAAGLGIWQHAVVAAALFLSWPAVALGGSLLTYRALHRR